MELKGKYNIPEPEPEPEPEVVPEPVFAKEPDLLVAIPVETETSIEPEHKSAVEEKLDTIIGLLEAINAKILD